MRFIQLFIFFIFLAIIAVFAVGNADAVTINLFPFNIEIETRLFLLVPGLLIFGFLMGRVSYWLSVFALRRRLKQQVSDNANLRLELSKMREMTRFPE